MRTCVVAPLVLMAGLALAPAASAAVLCVGTSGGDCTQAYATTGQAVGAALDSDTVRFGAGTFGPVDTTKVLTFIGVGAGTPASAAGATVIQQTASSSQGMNLPSGGTVRSLRVQGGPSSGMSSAGTGIQFEPSASGDMTLTLTDVIATGGATAPPAAAGGAGLAVGAMTAGSKVVNVTGGAFLASSDPAGRGLGVYTCCIETHLTNTLIRTPGGPGIYASLGARTTVDGTRVEGTDAIQTQAPELVTVRRSTLAGVNTGLWLRGDTFVTNPTNASIRDSLVTAGNGSAGLATVQIESSGSRPVGFEAVGTTFVALGDTQAVVYATRPADGSPALTATLRNSVARAESSTGVDLWADRATIGAGFSSFNTRRLDNGGQAPEAGSGSNVAGDPLLAPDHALQPGSPLIDRGDPSVLLPGELDLVGAARSLDGNGDCAAVPDIGAFERPSTCVIPPNVPPELTSVGVTNRVFAPVRRGGRITATAKRRVKRGTRFRYTLSEPARMAITIQRRVVRRRGKQRRVRWPTVVVLRADKQGGKQRTAFTGRVRRRAVKRGVYRARLVATDSLGERSKVQRIFLRVVRP